MGYGGIAAALKSYYDATVALHPTANGTALKYNGQFAQKLQPSSLGFNDDGTPKVLPEKCNTSFPTFGWYPIYADPTSFLLDSVRTTMFYSSVFAADQDMTSVQTIVHQNDLLTQNEYAVLWKYWGALCAVTFLIIIFILPFFYGFWTLARKTTLSPLETARAFSAPVLRDAPAHADSAHVLKEVGSKNLHTDLRSAADRDASSTAKEKE